MRHLFIVLAVAMTVAGSAGPVWGADRGKSEGRGEPTAESELPPFDRVAVQGFTDVTLVQGTAEGIALDGSPDALRGLSLDVTDGMLTITNPHTRRWWVDFMGDGKPARITLTYRKLNGLTVEGAATVRADRLVTDRLSVAASGATTVRITALEANDLTVTGSGALKLDVAGRTVSQKIRISGAGDYQAGKLDSQTAAVNVSGAGKVVVRAQKTLDVSVTGAGSVEYFGDPKVTQDIRGIGSIQRRGSAD
jgi:hypothetical protein